MKVRIYGGRVGFGQEWEEEFEVDSDMTDRELDYLAGEMSADFMEYEIDGGRNDMYDYWYEWSVI